MSKNVTAPRRWKSSPNSPSTQLAYVTKPEIDLLVKANLHGSMKGKPNKGPKGIISLDGGGSDYQAGKTTYSTKAQSPPGTGGTGGAGGGSQGYQPSAWAQKKMQENKDKIAQQKAAADKKAQDQIDANNARRIAEMRKEQAADPVPVTEKKGILDYLAKIGHGPVQEGYIGDEAFKKTIPAGQHKLRSQFDRLSAKYGPGFAETSQGKLLRDYLSGVAVERGGGLGARDPEYGGGAFATEGLKPGEFDEAEAYRQELLRQISATGTPFGSGTDMASQLGGMDFDLARKGLTPDQYYNFTQQLMAADPTPGNMAYKAARPFSSGQLVQGIAGLMPGMGPIKALAKTALSPFAGVGEDAKQMFTDLRTKAGDVTGRPFKGLGQGISDWFKFNPPVEPFGTSGRTFAASPSVRPDSDRGGVIDAAQSVVNQAEHPWGAWIGTEGQPHTADFVDSDGDGVDDRWQTGPGVPRGIENAWNQSFQVGQPHPITLPQAPFSGQTDLAASQAAGYDIPIGGGQNPNFQDWYKNLGIMQNVYS